METPLHHAPVPGVAKHRLTDAETYGIQAGHEYDEVYDELGIKRSRLRPQEGHGTIVLFFGDSFIQGYDDAHTIPQIAYDWIVAQDPRRERLIVLNAAYSSYSPLIFTLQAQRLLPQIRPDYVVIDIDETDLFDDAVRYRPGIERDAQGRLIAIHPDPERAALRAGCARAGRLPLLTLQVLAAAYYQLRLTRSERAQWRAERPFAVAETAEPSLSAEQREQVHFFSQTLDGLFATLKLFLPPEHVLVVRHPHERHLDAGRGAVLNRQVGELVRAAATRHSLRFFDSQDELQRRFGTRAAAYYWKNDMHFNFDGMRAYGQLVGRELLKMLQETEPPT